MYIKKIQAEVQVQYFSRLGLQVKRPADAGFPWPVSLFSRISKKRTNGWATDRVEWQLKWLPKTRKRERKVNDKAPRPLRREVLSFGCYFRVLVLGCRVAGQHTLLLAVHRALNRVLILPATFCILCSPSLSSLYILSPVGPSFLVFSSRVLSPHFWYFCQNWVTSCQRHDLEWLPLLLLLLPLLMLLSFSFYSLDRAAAVVSAVVLVQL